MTDGITYRRVGRIALPMVISNATVPLLGAVDTAVIGQLGDPALLGAVGMGAIILTTYYWVFGFLRMSTSGLAAQAHGAGDGAETVAILLRALAIGVGAGLGLIVLQSVLFWGAFVIAPSSETVESHARTYLQIRIWGAPATIALYALNGWLIALERTRAVLVLQVWQNGFNIGLDVLFVLGLGWGIGGVAAATLIAEWTGLLLGLWLVRAKVRLFWAVAVARIANRAALTAMFQASGDIMARSILLQLSFTSFVFLGARFGDVTLAANHVLLQFLEIAAFALDGIAFAAESLVGQAVGARSLANLRLATRMSMHWGVGAAIALAALFAVAGYGIIDVMTTSQIVRSEARHYLPWLIAAPVIGVASWIYDGIFIGALMTRAMLRAIVAATLIYAVALCILIPVLGNHGLWAAMMVMLVARAVMMKRALPALYSRMQP